MGLIRILLLDNRLLFPSILNSFASTSCYLCNKETLKYKAKRWAFTYRKLNSKASMVGKEKLHYQPNIGADTPSWRDCNYSSADLQWHYLAQFLPLGGTLDSVIYQFEVTYLQRSASCLVRAPYHQDRRRCTLENDLWSEEPLDRDTHSRRLVDCPCCRCQGLRRRAKKRWIKS